MDRAIKMKFEFKGVYPETKITSDWSMIGDTNLGHVDIDEFRERIFKINPTSYARKIVQSGIAQVVGFPTSIQFPNLIMECREHQNKDSRKIIVANRRALEIFAIASITKTFGIPIFTIMSLTTKEQYLGLFSQGLEQCMKIINDLQMRHPKSSTLKFLNYLYRNDFIIEVNELVTFLSRIIGINSASTFEN